ncbi:MAG: LysR family transcriptional regulator [Myxococcota bacterium]
MEWLNYHHLYYFWIVAQEGGLAAAARRLRLSHSTVGAQVAQLEDFIGAKLFERTGRGLALTDVGRVALDYSDRIFGLGQEFLSTIRGNGPSEQSQLRIGVVQFVPKLLVRQMVGPVKKMFPDARMTFIEGALPELLEELASHRLEIVLSDAATPVGFPRTTRNHVISKSSLAIMCTLDELPGPFPECLDGMPFLLPTSKSAMRRTVDDWLATVGVRPHIVMEFDDTALLKVFAEDFTGAFPVPEVITAEVTQHTGARAIGETDAQIPFYVIEAERQLANPLIDAILTVASPGEVSV